MGTESTLISIGKLSNRWQIMGKQKIWNDCRSGIIPARKIGQNYYIDMKYVLEIEGNKDNTEGGTKGKILVD